ncbi:solute carrier family 41 member 1-like [Acanthaster planci]|uniref:Solute carrier family 41 member 1-like n=1 Tax=Acanthaster planci TaxID=133434 RepID=A0A8B7XM58_ACAPL|nr:solute carrier family 41 member 1-like [Acanthaster planci]XP_022081248.1 solute carrier family 41 member 1-like [Acanthaster planci]
MPTGKPSAVTKQGSSQLGTALRHRTLAKVTGTDSETMVPRIELETFPSPGDASQVPGMVQAVKDNESAGMDRTHLWNGAVSCQMDTDQGGGGELSIAIGNRAHDDDEDAEIETSFTEPLLHRHSEEEAGDHEVGVVDHREESSFSIALQVFLPYIIAGFGTVGAGLVLDIVQHWPVYIDVTEVFILVPALLGLKGNLEMTLASRLSTAANLGSIDDTKEQWQMIGGNLALTQCQALVVGFLASVAAAIMGYIPDGEINIYHILLLSASSLVTASLASGILGSIMVAVVLLSRKCHINPDNVATPIAASLGDLTTLALLSWITSLLYRAIGEDESVRRLWLAPCIIAFFLLLLPLWVWLSHRNKYTHDVLYHGWSPVIVAMVISSCGGLVLDVAIRQNAGVAVFSPVINGVGGNLVAVQASRISTHLHRLGQPGTLPPGRKGSCLNPCKAFFGSDEHSRSCRVLFLMVIPGQLIFLFFISLVKAGHTSITVRVTIMYLTVALIQVGILLFTANWLVHLLWKKSKDPDNFSIPYLTAVGDLLGTALLALGFYLTWLLGDRDSDVGD